MIAEKGWNSTLDLNTHARHGLSQEPEHDLGFHVQEGKVERVSGLLFSDAGKRQYKEKGNGDWGRVWGSIETRQEQASRRGLLNR